MYHRHVRVYISIDMEGVAGIVRSGQCMRGQHGYDAGCNLMTAEANAAALGAFEADATEAVGDRAHRHPRVGVLAEAQRPEHDVLRVRDALGPAEVLERVERPTGEEQQVEVHVPGPGDPAGLPGRGRGGWGHWSSTVSRSFPTVSRPANPPSRTSVAKPSTSSAVVGGGMRWVSSR